MSGASNAYRIQMTTVLSTPATIMTMTAVRVDIRARPPGRLYQSQIPMVFFGCYPILRYQPQWQDRRLKTSDDAAGRLDRRFRPDWE